MYWRQVLDKKLQQAHISYVLSHNGIQLVALHHKLHGAHKGSYGTDSADDQSEDKINLSKVNSKIGL